MQILFPDKVTNECSLCTKTDRGEKTVKSKGTGNVNTNDNPNLENDASLFEKLDEPASITRRQNWTFSNLILKNYFLIKNSYTIERLRRGNTEKNWAALKNNMTTEKVEEVFTMCAWLLDFPEDKHIL